MAKLPGGIFGPFYGKAGNVVGTKWKDLNVLRAAPGKKAKPPTPQQLLQQQRFALMSKVMRGMNNFLAFSFRAYAINKSGYNCALQYNLRNAITGNASNPEINYPTMLVSRGDLPAATAEPARSATTGGIIFSWTDNTGLGIARSDDHAILVCYDPVMNVCVFDRTAACRGNTSGILQIPHFSNTTVHTWLAFVTADSKEIISDSVYTGAVTVNV